VDSLKSKRKNQKSDQDIRDALARVTASSLLAKSPQLAQFLTFIVEESLAGRGDRLKAYTIATGAFGRDADFDPQTDPIVRVEAGRLRRAIEQYYATEGRDDPIAIEISPGGYVPEFRRRGHAGRLKAGASALSVFVRGQLQRLSLPRAALASIVIGSIVVVTFELFVVERLVDSDSDASDRTGTVQGDAGPSYQSALPRLEIEPVVTFGKPDAHSPSIESVRNFLLQLPAGNDDIFVTASGAAASGGRRLRLTPEASYGLASAATYLSNGIVRLDLTLTDNSTGELVWSRTIPDFMDLYNSPSRGRNTSQSISASLFSWYGVIHAHERSKRDTGVKMNARYSCILDAQSLLRHFDPGQYPKVRSCLEQMVAGDTGFEPGFALLARVYAFVHVFGTDAERAAVPPLDVALRLARRAIDLDFDSVQAHIALFVINFNSGDIAEGISHAERAQSLYPDNAPVLINFAIQLALNGQIKRGIEMLRQSDGAVTSRSTRVYFVRFLAAYLDNDMATASLAAQQMIAENMTWTHLAHAVAAIRSGDGARARRAFVRLAAIQWGWRSDPRGELVRFIHAPEIVDRLAADLVTIGTVESN
jgi:hypothetical protein